MKIDAPINEPAAADHATTAWCAARYTSHREEDNSYQLRRSAPQTLSASHADIASAQSENGNR
nr:BA14K family protein [Rhizobium leguminosarum]